MILVDTNVLLRIIQIGLMIEQRIPKLLTFNDAHFARYGEVLAINPFDVLGVPRV